MTAIDDCQQIEMIHDKAYAWKKARQSNLKEDWSQTKKLIYVELKLI